MRTAIQNIERSKRKRGKHYEESKGSQKRWKQLVTMLLVAALLVTGTPDVVGFASEGTQEQVTAAAEQSQKTQEKAQKESAQEETAQKEAVQDHEQMSEEAGGPSVCLQLNMRLY